MADVKALVGSAWNVPVRGAFVNLTSADVNSVLGAASGLAKGLFLVGAGLALAAVGLFALLRPKREDLPWDTLADVNTGSRHFRGVCLTKEIKLNCDSHIFTIPVDYITDYDKNFFNNSWTSLTLVDESKYNGVILSPTAFEFLTPLGKQSVLTKSNHSIEGCTIAEANVLRVNIDNFLQRESETAEKLLGTDIFHRFFLKT